MAVDASHITLLPPPNRKMTYETAYGSTTDLFPAPDFNPLPLSRKRSRDSSSFNPPFCVPNAPYVSNLNGHRSGEFTFLGEDVSSQIYQQQLEIDRLIAHHTEKVRLEMEEMRKQNATRLIGAVQEGIMKRLKTKDDEIEKIGRLNWTLEEKVRSLSVENQILKELVQTNEATANALRNKLQQVLAQVQLQQHQHHDDNAGKATVLVDDGESHCGSNNRQVVEERKVNDENEASGRLCRKCGKEESCVLLLPCRHLCVCAFCVTSVSFCPVCTSTKSAALHVNITSFSPSFLPSFLA